MVTMETPPRPKSPPEYPDVYGKHHLQIAVEALDKEIHFLQGELHSLEGIEPASRSCKEVIEFIGTNSDPLIKAYEKRNKSCYILKIFRAILCCNLTSICCSSLCLFPLKSPKWCCAQWKNTSCCHYCTNCARCNCCKTNCCKLDRSNCPECSCGCVCSCSKCFEPETCFCPSIRSSSCCTRRGGTDDMMQADNSSVLVSADVACFLPGLHEVSRIGEWIFHEKNTTSIPLSGSEAVTQIQKYLLFGTDAGDLMNSSNDGLSGMLSSHLLHLLAILVIIVVASRLLHSSLRRLRVPLIVCQHIAAILIFSFRPKREHHLSTSNGNGDITLDPNIRMMEQTIGATGILFSMFMYGVKFDVGAIFSFRDTKPIIFAVTSLFIPLTVGYSIYGFYSEQLDELFGHDKNYVYSMFFSVADTIPIALCEILGELGLLNSELGRLAISSSLIQMSIGWMSIILFNVVNAAKINIFYGIGTLLSIVGICFFVYLVIYPYIAWIVRTAPTNTGVREVHVFVIMLTVVILGLVSDMVGIGFTDGPVIMGMVLPPGPPVGTTLVQRVDLVSTELLLPLVFMHEGFLIDWSGLKTKLGAVLKLELIIFAMFITKFVVNGVSALCCKMSLKEGLILGLMMNFKGIVDMLVVLGMRNTEGVIHNGSQFTLVILPMICVTAICAPLVSAYYKPLHTRSLVCRTLQFARSQVELRVMACFFDHKPVPSLLEFLNLSSSSSRDEITKSICIYTLHISELQARSESSLICHREKDGHINPTQMDAVHSHFINFEKAKEEGVTVIPFTSITPLKSMHHDACSLIVQRNIAFVIVPFPRKNSMADYEADVAAQDLVRAVLEQAPCSVGIMVYDGLTNIGQPSKQQYNVGVIFLGGPDDREAITIASRVASHPSTHLTVMCFVISSQEVHDELEKQSDDEVIARLQEIDDVSNRVVVSETTLRNVDQIFSAIHDLGDEYDLLITGRKQQCLSMLGEEYLAKWTESPELGVIGDTLADDISGNANVLIVQQHQLSSIELS